MKFLIAQGWTDKNTLQSLDTENKKITPPEIQPKQFQSIQENAEQLKPPPSHEIHTSIIPQNCCCHNCCCGCGTKFYPNKTSPRNENKNPNRKCGKSTHEYDEKNSPRRNQQSNNKNKKQSNNQPSKLSGEKEKPPRIKRLCMLDGGVELVPLLARRRAMQRPVNLSTTDVTKNPNANK